jgi:hypothetical protein
MTGARDAQQSVCIGSTSARLLLRHEPSTYQAKKDRGLFGMRRYATRRSALDTSHGDSGGSALERLIQRHETLHALPVDTAGADVALRD